MRTVNRYMCKKVIWAQMLNVGSNSSSTEDGQLSFPNFASLEDLYVGGRGVFFRVRNVGTKNK